MKKNNLLNGAFVATFSIILVKVIGALYVSPFQALVGNEGGALYGYGYQIYNTFATISMVGLPLAISKLVAHFNSKNYYYTTERVYKLARILLLWTGIISFVIMFTFAEQLAYLIIGKLEGGNSIDDVVLVIRAISFTILVVPSMSVTRGYMQGFQFIGPSSTSQVIEQVVRIVIILVGGFITMKVLNLGVTMTVALATFAAFLSALAAFGYLIYVKRKNNKSFISIGVQPLEEEKLITSKEIIKLVFISAVPFVLVGLTRQIYNTVDLVTVVRTLTKLGYSAETSETIFAVLATYGFKLVSIVTSISMGFTVSLIPSITKSYTLKKHDEVRAKINKVYQVQMLFVLPLSVGLFVISDPVYSMFYGKSTFEPLIFGALSLLTIITTSFSISSTIMQGINRNKLITISLMIGLATKIILNVPLMHLFHKLNWQVGYAPITATALAYGATIIFNDYVLVHEYKVNLKITFRRIAKLTIITIIMALSVYGLMLVFPFTYQGRIHAFIYSGMMGLFGGIIYLFLADRLNLINAILGNDFKNNILRKLRLKK